MRIALIVSGEYGKGVHAVRQLRRKRVQNLFPLFDCPVANLRACADAGVKTALPEKLLVVYQYILHVQKGHHVGFPVDHAHFPYLVVNVAAEVVGDDAIQGDDSSGVDVTCHIEKGSEENIGGVFGIKASGHGLRFIHIIECFYHRGDARPVITGGKGPAGLLQKHRNIPDFRPGEGVHFLHGRLDDQGNMFDGRGIADVTGRQTADQDKRQQYKKTIVFHVHASHVKKILPEVARRSDGRPNRLMFHSTV